MSLWIPVTLLAAFMQNLRFMLQRHLKTTSLSTAGATYSRFLFSLPLIAAVVAGYLMVTGYGFPDLTGRFWTLIVIGSVCQILATSFVVALFAERNFTVGIALKKSEVILTAIVGLLVLGEAVTAMGLVAIAIGFAGVILLSDPPKTDVKLRWSERLFNKASGYGLGSGLLFGFSAVGYRGATLEIASDDPFLRAMSTLAVAIAVQVLVMTAYMAWRERDEIGRVLASWRVSSLIGVTSMLGSLGWFIAFTLQNAAYVKALGQVELIFTFIGSYFVFKERSSTREVLGVLLIVASILCLVVAL
ncbi:DMT family transporter [uncultured Litoreibacter sp.]|uniref:DMT family transporter n=1 Tax=uncultured Litoreibacter sp. TaxID=1392394 RepID=UPI00260637A4|nr:DMT family transporter [uncultured Litoreibacter sp.]